MANAAGEDRSSFQDWNRSWSDNAFGFCKATEGISWTDPTFGQNWANLKAEGKVRGAYHFFHPALSPVSQAGFFVDYVRSHGGFGPGDIFAADVEIAVGTDGTEVAEQRALARMHLPLLDAPMAARRGAVGSAAEEFCKTVAGLVGPSCPVLLYTYKGFLANVGGCTCYPLWVADFTSSPPSSVAPWSRWTIWQNADSGGQGGGDTDLFNGDAAQLRAWTASYQVSWPAFSVSLPVLRQGSADPVNGWNMVHRMQTLVEAIVRWNDLGSVSAVAQDGDFGPATEAGLKRVQQFFGLRQSGITDEYPWKKMLGAGA